MARVLILEGHRRKTVPVIRSLGRSGIEVWVASPEKISIGFFSKYCARRVIIPDPEIDVEKFYKALINIISRIHIDVLFPIDDSSTLIVCKHQDEIKQFTRILVPSKKSIDIASNKWETIKASKDLGVPVPETRLVDSYLSLKIAINNIGYPAILKPIFSSGSQGVLRINSDSDIWKAKKLLSKYGCLLVQEFIPRKEAIGYSAIYDYQHKERAFVIHRRLHEYPLEGGPSTLRETIWEPRIRELGRRLLTSLEWIGPGMVEFRIDSRDGIPKLMEINPRYWGSIALPIAAGVDFPTIHFRLAMNLPAPNVHRYKLGIKAKWLFPGEILYLFANVCRFRFPIDVFNVFNQNVVFDIFDLNDLGPSIGIIISGIKSLFSLREIKRVLRMQ